MWIDSHCHMDNVILNQNSEKIINECVNEGVNQIIIPSVSKENFDKVINLASKYKHCAYALGIHPMYLKNFEDSDLDLLEYYLLNYNAVAVGEIGMDLFIQKKNQCLQEHVFLSQLKIAKKFNLPVIMHVRGAIDLVLKNLRQIKVRGGIAHAFNGSFQQADQLIKLGFKLGFGGAMTYPRAKHLQSLAKELPIESIVLETDSPDMPPAWLNNGERNQPKELGKIAEFFCHLRGLKPSKTADIIRDNTIEAIPKLVELYT
jgi:TatD DNase family protein|tara:strand:+ start:2066 stop:2845 length:780 start_codon:yes stop_codon:yes gene_type:complete